MHIISRKRLKEFWTRHQNSQKPLDVWFRIIDRNIFETFNELKKVFPAADKVGNKVVFNIGGNKYRLITSIHFNRRKVFIRHILTHDEYAQGGWQDA